MITPDENDLLTRTGPGTRCGALLRRYWQPAALSEELSGGGAPLPVTILGEELVLFRDDRGRPGLVGLHCSHRGTDLSFGRVEDGGLRCLYHGWLYDIHGRCLEQPGEPGGGMNCAAIQHLAYPCLETAGVVFAYLGPGAPPLFPAYELFTVREDCRNLPMKTYHECNYLQGNEGNLDPVHLSFLHRISKSAEPLSAGSGGAGMARAKAHELNLRDLAPAIDAELTDYGVRIYSVRKTSPEENFVRITNFIMPNLCAVGGGTGGDGYQIDWHVPIDDTHHWKYTFGFRRSGALPERQLKERRAALGEGYRRVRNASNRYLQDREEMATGRTFTGLGTNFLDHDAWAVESQGPVQDRAHEHLSSTDKAIMAERKLLLQAIRDVEAGRDPLHVVRDAGANRFPHLFVRHEVVPSAADWKSYWKQGL
jgi:phenylpropionate dioxygenase-like ring-hydroxylating dioxygenase large terminal subunit